MAPGAINKFNDPMFDLRSFGSKCTVLKIALVTLLGPLGAPRSHSASPIVICPYIVIPLAGCGSKA